MNIHEYKGKACWEVGSACNPVYKPVCLVGLQGNNHNLCENKLSFCHLKPQPLRRNPMRTISTIVALFTEKPVLGVTKPFFSIPSFSQFFKIIKTLVTYIISCSYLTGVNAAKLQRHLPNMNRIQRI